MLQVAKINSYFQPNFRAKENEKTSLVKPIATVATIALGGLAGDVYGYHKGEKIPMDTELLNQEERISSRQSKIAVERIELKEADKLWKYSDLTPPKLLASKMVEPCLKDVMLERFLSPLHNENYRLVPNCVCIHGGDETFRAKVVKYIENVVSDPECKNLRFKSITKADDILEFLEANEAYFQETKKYTILEVKDMDKLIHSELSDHSTIAGMKRIMGKCARQYHTTLLFVTENPKELDEIAMGPHRVRCFSVDKNAEELRALAEEEKALKLELDKICDKKNEFIKNNLKKSRLKGALIGAGVGLLVAISGLLLLNCGKKKEEKFDIKV